MRLFFFAAAVLAAAAPCCVLAQGAAARPAPVDCGSFTVFHFRVTSGGRTPEQRAAMAMDVINKYLGGAVGKVTIAPTGKQNSRLLLNNEIVAILTPEDAAAEKQKTARDLALRWMKKLELAFNATKAQR